MAHSARCSDSASSRCDCDCGGELHGTRPGIAYRWIVESRRRPAEVVESPGLALDPGPVKGVDDVVVDVLAELVERSPEDVQQIEAAVEDVLVGQAWRLILDGKPPKRRLGRRHWLCGILADIAAMLDELADIPGALGEAVYRYCREAGWGKLRSKAAAEIVERLAQLAFGPALAPVSALTMKIEIAAVMFCPDLEKHPALNGAFARDLYDALELDE